MLVYELAKIDDVKSLLFDHEFAGLWVRVDQTASALNAGNDSSGRYAKAHTMLAGDLGHVPNGQVARHHKLFLTSLLVHHLFELSKI